MLSASGLLLVVFCAIWALLPPKEAASAPTFAQAAPETCYPRPNVDIVLTHVPSSRSQVTVSAEHSATNRLLYL
jgi:hypothetical protein